VLINGLRSTVREVKVQFEVLRGIPALYQSLYALDSEEALDDARTLASAGIAADGTLYCMSAEGASDEWANFHHFRSSHRPKKHIAFAADCKVRRCTHLHIRHIAFANCKVQTTIRLHFCRLT
jgi:hypothetical protein